MKPPSALPASSSMPVSVSRRSGRPLFRQEPHDYASRSRHAYEWKIWARWWKLFAMPGSDLFVTGTDTNVGKTVLSALLCAGLGHMYWKPIQTGTVEGTDRESVIRYAGIPESQTLPEAYRFEPPVSPHLAAKLAGVRIDLDSIGRPSVTSPLVIEGAGGVLVPINE